MFRYIDDNLNEQLSLQTVSEIAYFSPYHFHRIFKTITGETLNEYITRRRIEKSASELLHTSTAITEIYQKYGFNSNATFSRTFKKFYGISPTAFRKQHPHKFSKIRQLQSKNGKTYPDRDQYICVIDNLKKWIQMNANIQIKTLPKMELAYVSSLGPQNIEKAFKTLIKWATPKGLLTENTKMITVYHDSFKLTEAHKVRMSACMLLNKTVETEGEIGLTSIEEGKCIVARFEIGLEDFEKSWTGLFLWMNENLPDRQAGGYKKADRNPFEIYHNNFNDHPQKKCIVDFCIPVI